MSRACNRFNVISVSRAQRLAARVIVVPACTLVIATASAGQGQNGSVVKQVDHVMIRTNERERLVRLLADTLRLPVVWPTPGSAWTFSTGLALGDLNLEISPSARATATTLGDLALQPVDFASASRQLKERGLDPRDPGGYTDSAGIRRWTTLGFRHRFSGPAFFIVQYHQFDMDERRARFEDTLRKRRGGPLGLRRITEFRLSYSPDTLRNAKQSWARLLGGDSTSERFNPPSGPAIRLIPSLEANSSSMLIEVESLAKALRAANALRLVSSAHRDSVVLDPARFGGLRFTLVGRLKPRR